MKFEANWIYTEKVISILHNFASYMPHVCISRIPTENWDEDFSYMYGLLAKERKIEKKLRNSSQLWWSSKEIEKAIRAHLRRRFLFVNLDVITEMFVSSLRPI